MTTTQEMPKVDDQPVVTREHVKQDTEFELAEFENFAWGIKGLYHENLKLRDARLAFEADESNSEAYKAWAAQYDVVRGIYQHVFADADITPDKVHAKAQEKIADAEHARDVAVQNGDYERAGKANTLISWLKSLLSTWPRDDQFARSQVRHTNSRVASN